MFTYSVYVHGHRTETADGICKIITCFVSFVGGADRILDIAHIGHLASSAAIAQLGERQTEDLKVLSSILRGRTSFCFLNRKKIISNTLISTLSLESSLSSDG